MENNIVALCLNQTAEEIITLADKLYNNSQNKPATFDLKIYKEKIKSAYLILSAKLYYSKKTEPKIENTNYVNGRKAITIEGKIIAKNHVQKGIFCLIIELRHCKYNIMDYFVRDNHNGTLDIAEEEYNKILSE